MKFGKALKILKRGGTVRRSSWSGAYLLLIDGRRICAKDRLIDYGGWKITSEAVLASDWMEVKQL